MRNKTNVAVLVVLAVLAATAWAGASAGEDSASDATDLSGSWALDPDRSEMPARGGGFGGRGGGPGGSGGGRGGDPVGGARGSGGGPSGRPRGAPTRMADRISIIQDASTVTISDEQGNERVILTSGVGSVEGAALGEWKKGKLEVRTETARGQLSETFALIDEGRSLVVKGSMQGSGGRSMKFKRVYSREETEGATGTS